MDFDFDEDEFSTSSTRGSSSLRSSSSKVRRRPQKPSRSSRDVSSFVSSSSSTVSVGSSKVSVRGAGTSAWAVQDAGTYQMLQDECSYLCSTILTSRNPSQAIDAALDLALMISSRKTRSILWQGDNDAKEKAEEGDENLDSFEISSPSKKKRTQSCAQV